MKWRARRRIQKNGNSLTVAIPRVYLEELGWKRGSIVELALDDATGAISILPLSAERAAAERTAESIPLPLQDAEPGGAGDELDERDAAIAVKVPA